MPVKIAENTAMLETEKPIARAAITGATGFIGGKLARHLMAEGIAVAGLIRAASDPKKLPNGVTPLPLTGVTETDRESLATFNPEIIFHLAASGTITHTTADLPSLIDANVTLAIQLAEIASRLGAVFVAAGTFWEHADGTPTENPNSLYAATKTALQPILDYYYRQEGLRSLRLKLFDVYSHDDPRGRLLQLLCKAQRTGEALPLSPGEQYLDLIHVEDGVRAFVHGARLLRAGQKLEASYGVGTGQPKKLKDIVALLEKLGGKPVPVTWGGRPYRRGEVMMPAKLPSLPGWSAKITLEEGLSRLLTAQGG